MTRVYHRLDAAPDHRPRIVLFGMRCAFTEPTLAALIAAPNLELCAVVLPQQSDNLTRSDDPFGGLNLMSVADRAELGSSALRSAIRNSAPDLIVAACFPWRLPQWLLELAPRGCLNIHPSLLPDGRGPEPVFWTFRWGLTETGVTVHRMDSGFDTGPIVAQQRFEIGEEATTESLERSLAWLGADVLIEQLPAVLDGSARAVAQAGEPSRYAPIPQPGDLEVTTVWSVHHAARFLRAVIPSYGPVPVLVRETGQRVAVQEVIGIEDHHEMPEPMLVSGNATRIRFGSGVLTCRLVNRPQPLRVHSRLSG